MPIDIYKLFVTDEIISSIVQETNRYGNQILESRTVTRKSRLAKWIPTDEQKIKKSIGIIICMGLFRVPKIEHYWSKKQIYNYTFVRNHITRVIFHCSWNLFISMIINRLVNKISCTKFNHCLTNFVKTLGQCIHRDQFLSSMSRLFLSGVE